LLGAKREILHRLSHGRPSAGIAHGSLAERVCVRELIVVRIVYEADYESGLVKALSWREKAKWVPPD
jgi:hypothetical protein